MFIPDGKVLGEVRADPYRQNLLNLFLARNDPLLNNFEEHLLLMNLGNIDWRPLINLWSVLENCPDTRRKWGKQHNTSETFSGTLQQRSVSLKEKRGGMVSGDARA